MISELFITEKNKAAEGRKKRKQSVDSAFQKCGDEKMRS